MDILANLLISGTFVTLLGGILWYFIQNWMKSMEQADRDNEEKIDKARLLMDTAIKEAVLGFTVAVNELKNGISVMNESVNGMKTMVEVIKIQVEERNKNIDIRLTQKREWLEEQDVKILDHERRIGKIETTCQLYHKKG